VVTGVRLCEVGSRCLSLVLSVEARLNVTLFGSLAGVLCPWAPVGRNLGLFALVRSSAVLAVGSSSILSFLIDKAVLITSASHLALGRLLAATDYSRSKLVETSIALPVVQE
jgi:hypothetical protein